MNDRNRGDDMPSDEPAARFVGPPGPCDCHLHVFGDPARYPYSAARRNAPPALRLDAFLGQYLTTARRLGIERMVFVQPSTYGRDNACLLDAMHSLGPAVRGIVDIDERIPDAELQRMHAAGVRGVRINAGPPNRPPDPALMDAVLPHLRRMDALCAELGWQLDLLGPFWLYEAMHDELAGLRCKFTVAHFGMWRGQAAVESAGFRRFLELLRSGERRCWVKLTAPYRIGTPPACDEALPVARALIAAAPDRIVWGSDYPFLLHADNVRFDALFDLVPSWIPNAHARQTILVDNPKTLFDF
jgi:predicted TIM-barrel fold metal-dependent hydrolase